MIRQPKVSYEPDLSTDLWWCNSHSRRATYIRIREWRDGRRDTAHECDPALGGILLPCHAVDLTGKAEIE